jgi:hypothetical protein
MYGISYELEGAMNFVGSQVRLSACLFVCLSLSVCLCLSDFVYLSLSLTATVYLSLPGLGVESVSAYLSTARAREHITHSLTPHAYIQTHTLLSYQRSHTYLTPAASITPLPLAPPSSFLSHSLTLSPTHTYTLPPAHASATYEPSPHKKVGRS